MRLGCLYCQQYGSRHARIQRGGGRGSGPPPPSEKSQNIRFLSNTGEDPLKNHKTTKPAFNVGPSLARQRNAIKIAIRWRAHNGPLIVLFGSYLPSSTKNVVKVGQPLTKLSGSAHARSDRIYAADVKKQLSIFRPKHKA